VSDKKPNCAEDRGSTFLAAAPLSLPILRRNSSGSLAMFAAIRRASSRIFFSQVCRPTLIVGFDFHPPSTIAFKFTFFW
jgi:hypothetical protein